MSEPTFERLFCALYRCAPAQFEERALKKLLYPHARLMAPFLMAVNPDFFFQDLRLIQHLRQSTDVRDATNDLMNFKDAAANQGFWRGSLRLRISGRKAGKLARQLFSTKD